MPLHDGELRVHKIRHVPGAAVLKLHNALAPLGWLSENSYLYSLAMNTAWDWAKLALLSRKQKEMSTELAVATHLARWALSSLAPNPSSVP